MLNGKASPFPALNFILCQLLLRSQSNNDIWLTWGLHLKAKRNAQSADNCNGAIRELFNALLELKGLETRYKNMFPREC